MPTGVPKGAQMGAHEGAQVGTPRDAEIAALKQRIEVEKERGLRLAAEREVQALTAHLATAQQTIRMIEAAPPQVETRVERVEIPVEVEKRVEVPIPMTPKWVWPLVIVATVLLLLLALLTGWALTPNSQTTTSSQPRIPLVSPDTPSATTHPLLPVTTQAPSQP